MRIRSLFLIVLVVLLLFIIILYSSNIRVNNFIYPHVQQRARDAQKQQNLTKVIPFLKNLQYDNNSNNLLPAKIQNLLSAKVSSRFEKIALEQRCSGALSNLQKNKTQSLVFTLSTQRGANGGFSDRIMGIFSIFLLSLVWSRSMLIDYPELSTILYPHTLGSWIATNRAGIGKRIMSVNNRKNTMALCTEKHTSNLIIRTNYFVIPNGQFCQHNNEKLHKLLNESHHVIYGCLWWYLFEIRQIVEDSIQVELSNLLRWLRLQKRQDSIGIGFHIRAGDSHMNAGSGHEQTHFDNFMYRIRTCMLNLSRDTNGTMTHFVLVSDSQRAKSVAAKWNDLPIYISSQTPVHIDKSAQASSRSAILSTITDLFVLALQDKFLLAAPSGYGTLAKAIGLYTQSDTLKCDI